MRISYDTIPQLMIDVARDHILPHYQNLQNAHIAIKTDGNKNVAITDLAAVLQTSPDAIVTVADLEAETAFRAALAVLHPGRDFIGEESFFENDSRPIRDGAIADPIDGTRYFANGLPDFGSMLAFVEDGALRYAAIYQPCTNDLLIAQHHGGVLLNEMAMTSASPVKDIKQQTTIGHFDDFASETTRAMQRNLERHDIVISRHVCSSMDYLRFARGEIDNMVYKNAYPWDVAAGALMVKETGGHAALIYSEQDLTDDLFSDIEQPVLMTRHREDWAALKTLLLS